MEETKENQSKPKQFTKWFILLLLAVFAVVAGIIVGVALHHARADEFDGYQTDRNDYEYNIMVKPFVGDPDSGYVIKYSLTWYMFMKAVEEEQIGTGDKKPTSPLTSANFPSAAQFKAKEDISKRGETDSEGVYEATMVVSAEDLIKFVKQYGNRSRSGLREDITVYFNPVVKATLYYNGAVKKTETCYTCYDALNAPEELIKSAWSGGTWKTIYSLYNKSVTLQFQSAGLSYEVVDTNGNSISNIGVTVNNLSKYDGFVLYGETIGDSTSPGKLSVSGAPKGYTYAGYYWSDAGSVNSLSGTGTGISNKFVDYDTITGDQLVLYIVYKADVPEPVVTAAPTVAIPTGEPAPLVTVTPAPTPQPSSSSSVDESYEYYFSTDQGYTMDTIGKSTSYRLPYTGSTNGGTLAGSDYTKRTVSYQQLYDADGNQWFCRYSSANDVLIKTEVDADGVEWKYYSNFAEYVHPSIYQGYDACTEEVRYITELTFPETLERISYATINGKPVRYVYEYKVTSIGGGGSKYHAEEDYSQWNSLGTSGTDYKYSAEYGSYYEFRSNNVTASSTTAWDRNFNYDYAYGVIGNGRITGSGTYDISYFTTGASQSKYYQRNYYVYNTSLYQVTIPDTVTTILPYAFAYCQKLTKIEGGEGVISVGSSAFLGASAKTLKYSWTETENYDGDTYSYTQYYYYNLSCARSAADTIVDFTDIMYDWEEAVTLSGLLYFPDLKVLKTIGGMAFAYHDNLYEVVLSDTVTSIANKAFYNDKLDSITIPGMNTAISGDEDTLGTNGTGSERTLIITQVNSKAMTYGIKYRAYYRLKCGYPVVYQPNGGEGAAISDSSLLMFRMVNLTQTWMGTGTVLYGLDENGDLYVQKGSLSQGTIVKVEGVTGLTEKLFSYDSGSYSYAFFKDKNGEIWRAYLYSTTPSVIKVEFVGTPVTMLYSSAALLYANESGEVYYWNNGTNTLRSGERNLQNTFTYAGCIAGTDASGEVGYFSGTSWKSFGLPTTTSYVYVWGSANKMRAVDKAGVLWFQLTTSGSYPWKKYGDIYAYTSQPTFDTQGELFAAVIKSSSYYDISMLVDGAGTVYLVNVPSGTGTGSRDSKKNYPLYVEEIIEETGGMLDWKFLEVNASTSNNEVNAALWVMGKDGSFYSVMLFYPDGSVDSTFWAFPGEMANGTKFTKIQLDLMGASRSRIMALDTNGYLWSTGYNYYGELGTEGSYKENSSIDDICSLYRTGNRTYQDFRMDTYCSFALGTDGKLYGAGNDYYLRGIRGEYITTFSNLGVTNVKRIGGVPATYVTSESVLYPREGYALCVDGGYDFVATIRENTFIRQNFEFTGWNTSADGLGTAYRVGESFMTTQSLTLYAQWKNKSKTVFYHGNGGSSNGLSVITKEYEAGIAAATVAENTFVRQGYVGKTPVWNTKADGTGTVYAAGAAIALTGETHLYVQWRPQRYTVHFAEDAYGLGTEFTTEVWTYGDSHTMPGEPYSKEYTVSYDVNKGNKSTSPVMLTTLTDMHRKAKFTFSGWRLYRNKRTIASFKNLLNGLELGSAAADSSYGSSFTDMMRQYDMGARVRNLTSIDYDELTFFPVWGGAASYVTLPIAECTGYEFYGWASSPKETDLSRVALAGADMDAMYQPRGNEILYAIYLPKNYTIILDGRGATTQTQKTVNMTFDARIPSVSVPQKTGYTFHGYYTGTKGTGVQYYDETGVGQCEWLSDSLGITTLYASWTQDEIIYPEENPYPEPDVEVEETIDRTIGLDAAKILVYADDYNSATNALTDLQPYLAYDVKKEGVVVSEGAIPSTEQVCVRAKMGAWMMSYSLAKLTGTSNVRVHVTVPYQTQYELADETLVISEVQYKTIDVMVPKAWSYWSVLAGGVYRPKELTVSNPAFSESSVLIPVVWDGVEAALTPDYTMASYGAKEHHLLWNGTTDADGTDSLSITLTKVQYIISDEVGSLPETTNYLTTVCKNAAWEDTSQYSVRNDALAVEGITLLSDAVTAGGRAGAYEEVSDEQIFAVIPEISYTQIYRAGIDLEDTIANGTYATTAEVTYEALADVTGSSVSITKELEESAANAINIHTPVACDGSITIEGQKAATVLELKEDFNPLEVSIENKGLHQLKLGYGEQDFRYALSGTENIAVEDGKRMNQVKFPFEVLVVSRAGEEEWSRLGDEMEAIHIEENSKTYRIGADVWVTLEEEVQTFYVSVTQQEGEYEIAFRSIAVNCPKEESGEWKTDYLELPERLREQTNRDNTVYAAYDTAPLEIRGYVYGFSLTSLGDSEAETAWEEEKEVPVMKKGYPFSFRLRTNGSLFAGLPDISYIRIMPTYEWVSSDKQERVAVNVYYSEKIGDEMKYFVAAGDAVDAENSHSINKIELPAENRTFPMADSELADFLTGYGTAIQEWHGTYYLPALSYATLCDFNLIDYAKSTTLSGREEFFLQEGYLVLTMQIEAVNSKGDVIAYSSWNDSTIKEAFLKSPFSYKNGDILCYDLEYSVKDDYEVYQVK